MWSGKCGLDDGINPSRLTTTDDWSGHSVFEDSEGGDGGSQRLVGIGSEVI